MSAFLSDLIGKEVKLRYYRKEGGLARIVKGRLDKVNEEYIELSKEPSFINSYKMMRIPIDKVDILTVSVK